jgi:hypothetical protein
MEYRNALVRPRCSERDEQFRIPRDEGQAAFLEALGMLSVIAVLAVVLGLAVRVPLAMALNDICASLNC